jgi:hypothetical protein
MAQGDLYVTLAQMKTRLGISDTADDAALTSACTATKTWIDNYCNRRRFGFQKASAATARLYRPSTSCRVRTDDISSTTSLVVKIDTGNNGGFDTTWTSGTNFLLEPLDAVASDGDSRPYTSLSTIDGHTFPCHVRPAVQVTALWGWPAVPSLVTEAAYQLAEETFKLKDAPFGVAGVNDFGVLRIGNQTMNRVQAMLADYVAGSPVLVA